MNRKQGIARLESLSSSCFRLGGCAASGNALGKTRTLGDQTGCLEGRTGFTRGSHLLAAGASTHRGGFAPLRKHTMALEKGTHGVGGLGALLEPVTGAFDVEVTLLVLGRVHRVVKTKMLQDPTIPRAAGIGDRNSVAGAVAPACALETDDDGHGRSEYNAWLKASRMAETEANRGLLPESGADRLPAAPPKVHS